LVLEQPELLVTRAVVAFVVRGALLWCMARGVAWYYTGSSATGALWAVLVSLALVALDIERGNERIFYANMGFGTLSLAGVSIGLCLVCELVLITALARQTVFP
jgi:hypothetical protein